MGLGLVLSELLALLNNIVPVHEPSQIVVKEKAPFSSKTEAFLGKGNGGGLDLWLIEMHANIKEKTIQEVC